MKKELEQNAQPKLIENMRQDFVALPEKQKENVYALLKDAFTDKGIALTRHNLTIIIETWTVVSALCLKGIMQEANPSLNPLKVPGVLFSGLLQLKYEEDAKVKKALAL